MKRRNSVKFGDEVKVRLLNGRNLVSVISDDNFESLTEAINRGFCSFGPGIDNPRGWSVEVVNYDRDTCGRYNYNGRKI